MLKRISCARTAKCEVIRTSISQKSEHQLVLPAMENALRILRTRRWETKPANTHSCKRAEINGDYRHSSPFRDRAQNGAHVIFMRLHFEPNVVAGSVALWAATSFRPWCHWTCKLFNRYIVLLVQLDTSFSNINQLDGVQPRVLLHCLLCIVRIYCNAWEYCFASVVIVLVVTRVTNNKIQQNINFRH